MCAELWFGSSSCLVVKWSSKPFLGG